MTEDFRTKFGELEEKINQLNAEVKKTHAGLKHIHGDYDYLLDTVHARGILLRQAQEYRYYSQTTLGLKKDFEEMAIANLKRAVEITYDSANKVIAGYKRDIDKVILATGGRDGI